MYEVLTGGKHPFWIDKEDNTASFMKKLKNLQMVEADPCWSKISKHLFSRLTQLECHQRYTAKDALQHPWITRMKQNQIPQNLTDKLISMSQEDNLRQKLFLAHFLCIQKLHMAAS